MADNITLNPGSGGSVVASDDISGVQHQLVKVEFGADGVATPVSDANPLPVQATASNPLQVREQGAPSIHSETLTVSTGNSPQTVDLNASLGRNATTVLLQLVSISSATGSVAFDCDGSGSFSNTLVIAAASGPLAAANDIFKIEGLSIDTLRFTEAAGTASYRIFAY